MGRPNIYLKTLDIFWKLFEKFYKLLMSEALM